MSKRSYILLSILVLCIAAMISLAYFNIVSRSVAGAFVGSATFAYIYYRMTGGKKTHGDTTIFGILDK